MYKQYCLVLELLRHLIMIVNQFLPELYKHYSAQPVIFSFNLPPFEFLKNLSIELMLETAKDTLILIYESMQNLYDWIPDIKGL